MSLTVTTESRVRTAPGQTWCEVGGEAAILNTVTGVYYGLNPIGTLVWKSLEGGTIVNAICDTITDSYEVDRSTCEADVIEVLQAMLDAGLIEVL